LIIDDVESNRERRKVMACLTDEEEEEAPLTAGKGVDIAPHADATKGAHTSLSSDASLSSDSGLECHT
jgi:hypothetical protein